jgi:hypothetical protein
MPVWAFAAKTKGDDKKIKYWRRTQKYSIKSIACVARIEPATPDLCATAWLGYNVPRV